MVFSLFGLWSNRNLYSARAPERSISSENNNTHQELETAKLYKLKNIIWNKVLSAHDFENFNDSEYFKWMEIYKDGDSQLSNLNPVSIEQKMALIEVINKRLILTPLYSEKNLTKEALHLNSYKLNKLKSHMKNFDMSTQLSGHDLQEFASDLMIILKGPPMTLIDYFSNNKTPRMNANLLKMVQEDILLMGLKELTRRIPEEATSRSVDREKLIVKKFFSYKTWKYLVTSSDLSWLEKVNISEELLEKIIINGLENHDEELIAHLKKHNMIDYYERFRKVYKPIPFSIGLYLYYEKYNFDLNPKTGHKEEIKNETFIDFFKNISIEILETKPSF